jgi:hypothetical protein
MTIAVLELQRARKHLEAFCRRRNALSNSGSQWRLNHNSGGFVLIRGDAGAASAAVKLQFAAGRWLLSVPAAGGWQPYPPRPEAEDIKSVIDELEQAPLHVHWA